ncbi:MAG: LysM peptidoglycan-binding domain-containing protein [Chloroflexota bacterium]|nr:LysM peptidoglycan-binding domain-containing protein [Chloroflexota bacterium]MCY3583945.1 LysM peptidoglycan-binding domain-containing protein [Chloroflexota bacterium]MDE2651395.1 LysM peptidoglycan-binding domain-containing protein [Chloroflexota bacterium]MYE77513.1 LysM peptidoglycan-binding domain-containing protein [Chloroflexota bacterium]MYH66258.1 LysM peptidoglycan-binding domain-containing protein [Chloroflexota bacterium]
MSRVFILWIFLLFWLFPALAGGQEIESSAPEGLINYTVQPGDTLYGIAKRYAISVDALRGLNDLHKDAVLGMGAVLLVPPLDNMRHFQYEVKAGDTLYVLARLFGASQTELMRLNAIAAADSLRAGQVILVPHPSAVPPKPGFGYGIHIFLDSGTAKELTEQARQLGVNWAKIDVAWSRIEAEPGNPDYSDLDALVRALDAAGIKLLLTIYAAPDWSRASYLERMNSSLRSYGGPPADLADFADFISRTAARYAGLVDAYEIWKAPNLLKYWNVPVYEQAPAKTSSGDYGLPAAIDLGPAQYAALLEIAYRTIKAHDADALVVSAGLAPVGFTDNYNSIATDRYLDELLALGAAEYTDGIGAIFSASAVPPTLGCCAQPPGVESHYESFIQNFDALMAHYAATMDKHGIDLPLWLTQVGWGTADGANLAVPATGYEWLTYTSQAEQALYIRQAYQLAQGMDALSAMFLYNLNGCAVRDAEACFFSLVDAEGARRPVFDAYAAAPKAPLPQ